MHKLDKISMMMMKTKKKKNSKYWQYIRLGLTEKPNSNLDLSKGPGVPES